MNITKSIKDAVNLILTTGGNNVIFIINYGSYINGNFHEGSDIDLCIYYSGDKKERFNFRLSVLSSINDIFDVQIFQDLPLYIRKDVLKGRLLYSKNNELLYDIARDTIYEFDDFKRGYYDIIGLEKIQ